jgi:hypothetical protein
MVQEHPVGVVPRSVATICACTVVVPLPNSAVPIPTRYRPSGVRSRVTCEMWPNGAIVAIIATAILADEPARGRRDAVAAREGVVGEIEALVEAVAAPDEVRVGFAAVMEQVVAILHRVATTQFERIDAELDRELVHGALDREDHLAEAVASERAGGHGIGVHDLGIQPLRGASIEAQRLGDAVEEHASGVVAVGARVGEHVDVHGGEDAVLVRSERHRDPHGVTHRGALELLTPRQLVRDGPAGAQHAECDEIFAEEFLLAAEPAADPSGMHAMRSRSSPRM